MTRASWLAATVATAATYVYFLLFAQFALLALVRSAGVAADLRGMLAAMGGGGIAGAVGAAWRYRPLHSRGLLLLGFVLCAGAAEAATVAPGAWAWGGVFALVGFSLGALTVVLAATLRRAAGTARLGLSIGLGTGAAYAFCNLPGVFTAEPRTQTWLAVAAAAVGALAVRWLEPASLAPPPPAARGVVLRWVAALTALVWMDSAIFSVIQQTPALRAATWEGEATLWANAVVHLAAGVGAGWWIDQGWRRAPVLAALALLGGGSALLAGDRFAWASGGLYVAGVSLYSVALVHFPASSGRAGVAALVFAVAGWVGSAAGIGMGQDLHRIPGWFVALAAGTVLTALGGRRAAGWLVLAGVAGAGVSARAADDFVARGREVYIREGCIHCHSQYVRPGVSADVERWGPSTPLGEVLAGAPPLPGNRRQGPDLAHVGNRRSGEWNRLHLCEPRAVSPGSRMPSYAHLFAGGDPRGEALVAYLATLGADTIPARLAQAQAWQPAAGPAAEAPRARALFKRLCANCHGPAGRGDGPLAERLSVRPPDWSREAWRRVPAGADVERDLARVIKFGVPGTPMAGHEYLNDADVVGLARLVQQWQKH